MKVDYHFHPNLLGKNPAKRLNALWKAIEDLKFDAMVCTEHSFKSAPEAYRLLAASKPAHLHTQIFPGAELVTQEGVDVIVFAEHDWYDEHPLLLKPFGLTLSETLRYLAQTDLTYFIPHPVLYHNPLKSLYREDAKMKEFLHEVPAVESFNGCYLGLDHLSKTSPVFKLGTHVFRRLSKSARVPTDVLKEKKKFIAIGSDAHHPKDLGFAVEIPGALPHSRTGMFQKITSNTDVSTLHYPKHQHPIVRLAYTIWTTFSEGWMRREWKRYTYQHSGFRDVTELELAPQPETFAVQS